MIELTRQYGRYGYRRIAALLREAGWSVSDGRAERLWRRVGLKVPIKQPKKRRLWLNDGSSVRLRSEHQNHVWSYDFVHCRTDDGKAFRTLNIIDEHSRECLVIRVKRKLNSTEVIDVLTDLFILRARRVSYVQITSRNLSFRLSETGSPPLAPIQLTSNLGAHGRTGIVRALMAGSGMSYSTVKSSTAYAKLKF